MEWCLHMYSSAEIHGSLPSSQHHFITVFTFLLLLPFSKCKAVRWHKSSCLSSWHSESSGEASSCPLLQLGKAAVPQLTPYFCRWAAAQGSTSAPQHRRGKEKQGEKCSVVQSSSGYPQEPKIQLSVLARLAKRILIPVFVPLAGNYKEGRLAS